MPKRDLLIMVVAGISGIVIFMIMLGYLKNSRQSTVVQSIPLVRCVAAAETILKDQTIKETSVVLSKPAQNQNVSDYFVNVSDLIDYIAKEDIPKDSLIKRNSVAKPAPDIPKTPPKPQSLPVPAGLRSMTVKSDAIVNLPADLNLGAYVDFIGKALNADGQLETKTIASAVQIIGLNKMEGADIPESITVAARPRNVVELTKALGKGKLSLVNRPESATNLGNLGYIEIIRGISKEKSFQGQEYGQKER
jgi:Flp pilus assembly protein CpaB